MATNPNPSKLDVQVAVEQKEIELAPIVKQPRIILETGMAGRCAGCGRWSDHLVPCHDYAPDGKFIINERYKGFECCGGRHG